MSAHRAVVSARATFLAAAALLAATPACSQAQRVVSLSVSTPDSTMPAVGDRVHLVVRAIFDDASSEDVSGQATCVLDGTRPTGQLAGTVFTAEAPGATVVTCRYEDQQGGLALVVAGDVLVSAADVQEGRVAAGERVSLEIVVTGLDPEMATAGTYSNFYGQDEGGGPHSGLYFRDLRAAGEPPVAEGQRVRATGAALERLGRTVLEFDVLEVVGTGTPVVDTLAIADVDAAIWDGCLVSVEDVEVTSAEIETYFWQVAAQDALMGAKLYVDTLLYDPLPAVGARFTRVTGPVYVFELTAGGVAASLQPRRAEDVTP